MGNSAVLKLFVQFADDCRLDRGKAFGEHVSVGAERRAKVKNRTEVEDEDYAMGGAELPDALQDDVPDPKAFDRLGRIYPVRARRARGAAGFAVAPAPAEVPFGESGETFFSVSRSSAGPR